MKIGTFALGLCLVLTTSSLTNQAHGALSVHVDLDADTLGIQTSREVVGGESIRVAFVAEPDSAGVSSYGFSVMYDNLEVSLISADDTPPVGMTNLVAGVTDVDLGGGTSQLASFDAFTFTTGPADTSFVFGTVDFIVETPLDDGAFDITLGYFAASDGAFDNSAPLGVDLGSTTVFNDGILIPVIIPEPSAASLALFASLLMFSRRRRKA